MTHYVHVLPAQIGNGFDALTYADQPDPKSAKTLGVLKVTVTGNKIEAVQVH